MKLVYLQTGSRARKYKIDDQGNSFIDFGKIESNQPMFDARPAVEEKVDGSEFSDISRPWDNWDEWEHRSALLLDAACFMSLFQNHDKHMS